MFYILYAKLENRYFFVYPLRHFFFALLDFAAFFTALFFVLRYA